MSRYLRDNDFYVTHKYSMSKFVLRHVVLAVYCCAFWVLFCPRIPTSTSGEAIIVYPLACADVIISR